MTSVEKEMRSRIVAYLGGAFGLVAGLAWNEAILELINYLFPVAKNGLWVKFGYAVVVTVLVVVVILLLERLLLPKEEKGK